MLHSDGIRQRESTEVNRRARRIDDLNELILSRAHGPIVVGIAVRGVRIRVDLVNDELRVSRGRGESECEEKRGEQAGIQQ
jgi:hypothetical protein